MWCVPCPRGRPRDAGDDPAQFRKSVGQCFVKGLYIVIFLRRYVGTLQQFALAALAVLAVLITYRQDEVLWWWGVVSLFVCLFWGEDAAL